MTENYFHDPDLLARLAEGEPATFAAIYTQYYPRIYSFAKSYLPDREDAEDVTADTFVKLWNRRRSFTDKNNIAPFLYVTARNSCFDFLRHLKIKTQKQAELIKQLELNYQSDMIIQEIREELKSLIQAEVDKMSDKMKEIFQLSYEEGLTPSQIAANLHISVQTVSNQKTNVLKSLKKALVNKCLFFLVFLFPALMKGLP